MCNRYSLANVEALRRLLDELGLATPEDLLARYNLPLTAPAPIVVQQSGHRRLGRAAFGLELPPREPGGRPMLVGNARAETLLQRPAFRDAARHRRCAVPADGFFEWEKVGARRQPHHFHRPDRSPFFFAGLWRPDADGTPASFVIVTTTPNAVVAPIHDRMPVVLDTPAATAWLGDEPLPPERLGALCVPCPAELLARHPVDPRVGQVRFDEPACLAPWTPPREPTLFD